MKKIWKKPNLIVLIRSRPEENVLQHCKYGWSGLSGASAYVGGCHAGNEGEQCYGVCEGNVAS